MITMNGTVDLPLAAVNEAYKLHNLRWEKVLIVRLPRAEFSLQEAIDLIKPAKVITNTEESAVTSYYLNGMLTAKEDDEFCYIWMFNTNATREENSDTRISELEQTIDALLGGEADA